MDPETLFNQNFAAIQAAKQQTGDWEKAFQQVTGMAWPKGQHIEVDGNTGRMVKDAGWKKVLGKALPFAAMAAAPFTGGASMAALLGAGAGAAGSALQGGGWKGALMGGATGALSGLAANKAGSLIRGMMNKGGAGAVGNLAGTSADTFVGPTLDMAENFVGPTLEQAGGLIQNGSGGGNWISKLMGGAKNILGGKGDGSMSEGLADASSLLGAYGQSEATNRYVRGKFMQDYDQLNLNYDQQNRARESDALRKLGQTSYIQSGGAPYKAPLLRSGQTADLGYGPKAPSAAQVAGAKTLEGTLLNRLTPGGALKPTDPNTYTKEGKMEKAANIGGLITGGLGAWRTMSGKDSLPNITGAIWN